jgi:class 3 adenylate cyclase
MGMNTHTEDGMLVLADVSGFTEFVTATELEHGPPIIADLLGEVMRRLSPPLEIQEVEGDAVFALGPDGALLPPAQLLQVFDSAVAAFKETRRQLAADESCSCGACRSIERLDLKIIAHHGRFLRHSVGGRAQVAGVDVILAHRLLKNGVTTSRAYVLLTDALLDWLGVDAAELGLVSRVETYEHLGDVRCFLHPLDAPTADDGLTSSVPGDELATTAA